MKSFAFGAAGLIAFAPAAAAVIGTMVSAQPIGEARIAGLPTAVQAQWRAYLARSQALMAADKAALAAERADGRAVPAPERGKSQGDAMPLDRPAAWYGGPEARLVADNIVSFQTPAGGWGKNQNRAGPPRALGEGWAIVERLPTYAAGDIQANDRGWAYVGTIDNGATTTEMRFLARVQAQSEGGKGDTYRMSFLKGVRYLLAAQYPNGGWPQVFPLQGGYHDAITFNDGALTDVASLMAAIGGRNGDFAFVPEPLAAEARGAAERAIGLILSTQVIANGRRTIWAQQHDALTLAPTGARRFEPAGLSTAESAGILRFLMAQPQSSPEIVAAVCDGVAWLRTHALADRKWVKGSDGGRLVAEAGAPPIWARLYDQKTFTPIFGDRDGVIRDDVGEVSAERRSGYSWFNSAPSGAIRQFERWPAAKAGCAVRSG
jgi:PelA/Pel-15E family pectate lyase